MSDIVLVAPWFDIPTSISFNYAEELEQLFEDYGADYTRLRVFKATQLPLRLVLKTSPRMLIYAGHAFEDALLGQFIFNFPFISPLVEPRNAGMLRDMIVVAIPACLNGQVLGPESISRGVQSWFGSLAYMYAAFPEPEHDYQADFKQHWKIVPTELLKGRTTGEALQRYVEYGTQLAQLYNSKQSEWGNADDYLFSITENTSRLRLFGNPSAKFWD